MAVRGERELVHGFRIGTGGGWQRASFQGVADTYGFIGADVTYDTRVDPVVPRDAVFVRTSWEHLPTAMPSRSHPTIRIRYWAIRAG